MSVTLFWKHYFYISSQTSTRLLRHADLVLLKNVFFLKIKWKFTYPKSHQDLRHNKINFSVPNKKFSTLFLGFVLDRLFPQFEESQSYYISPFHWHRWNHHKVGNNFGTSLFPLSDELQALWWQNENMAGPFSMM